MEATDIARATEPSRRPQWAPRSDPTTCAWAVCGPSQLGLPRFLTAKQGKTQNSVFPGQMGCGGLIVLISGSKKSPRTDADQPIGTIYLRGLRRSEAVWLTWVDVDLDAGTETARAG